MEKKDIEYLAELSKIELSGEEITKFQEDLGSILKYVDQVKEASASLEEIFDVGVVHNVLREDTDPDEKGENREEIIAEFPEKDGDYLKVKKILP